MIDYVEKFSKLPPSKAKRLKKKLMKEVDIDEEKAVQIINIMPKTPEEVREIFHERVIIGDLANKILEIIWRGR
jgi:DNA-directed RNA polymerase subunit F